VLATGALAAPPELGWEVFPGMSVGGSRDSQSASSGPIQGAATNGLTGLVSDGAASADYGVLGARTTTSVDAGAWTSGSFCLAPHCSDAEAFWSDRLIFSSPGLVPNGTTGSFTAQVTISGALAATIASSWQPVSVGSLYDAQVELDGVLWERITVSCMAIPIPGFACIPVPLQLYLGDPPASTSPPAPFGTFVLGPYDFVWGEPFDVEMRLRTEALVDLVSAPQPSGVSSADTDLANGLVFDGVLQLFDGPGGTGSGVPLASALVSPASGVAWLKTVPVPEPPRGLQLALAVLATAVLTRRRRDVVTARSAPRDRRRCRSLHPSL
jgi:hypothetical protein